MEFATKHYDDIEGCLKRIEPFGRQQLHDALSNAGSRLSYNSMGGVLADLIRSGNIERVGHNRYVITRNERTAYRPVVSEQLSQVIAAVNDAFPLVEFLAWDTLMLNEFLNHQIANNTLFVESEAMLDHAVFEHLRQRLDGMVLYKPDPQSLDTYWEPGIIIVQKLTTQVPGQKSGNHLPALEKLIVDLFANKLLAALFSQSELPAVLEQIFENYIIDESALFRYAGRRNCYERIKVFIKDKTDITLRSERREGIYAR